MLNLMRKHAGSWMIKIILFAIVVVFVFWGVGSMRSQKATQVADVNGEVITLRVYRQAYYRLLDYYRRIYGEQFNDDVKNMLKPERMALNQIIDRVVQQQEAVRLNIEVGENELAQSIYSIPAFQVNGAFNKNRYLQVLAQNNLSDEGFRTDRSQELLLNKLRVVVMSGVSVSEDEAMEWYNWDNAQVRIEYALFSPDQYQDVTPTDEQVNGFFESHKDNYRTEPKVKVRYLRFNPDAYKADVKITDQQISSYYDSRPDQFKTEKRVKARHILFKAGEGVDDAVVESKKAEAMNVYEMAKAGKDFSELAKQYSEGPSKNQGGDLGWFTRDRMVKAFSDKAFGMDRDEISAPVRTSFGWHIIKVDQIEEATTRSLQEATAEIRATLTAEKAKETALEKAEALYDSVFDGDDLAEAGKAHQIEVRETDFFTAGGPAKEGIVQMRQFGQTAFDLEKMAISEIQDFGNGYYILQLVERQDPVIPEFDQVETRVRADTMKDLRQQRAKADAESFLSKVKEGEAFRKAGEPFGITAKETQFFKRNGVIAGIGNEQQINKAAFALTPEKPLSQKALQTRQGWCVFRLKKRQPPDSEGFGDEKENIVNRLTEQKRQSVYQSWLADLKSRSKIDINQELLQP
jgi:peptidyl-prolyl cis-trans isomerase D